MTGTSTGTRLQVFSMPDVGEGLTEAEVLGWRVAVGDTVTVNQVLVEMEQAAVRHVPPAGVGLVEPGVTVEVGTPIMHADPGAGDLPDSSPPAPSEPAAAPANGSTDDEGSGTTTNGEGANADGRIATLVGYVSAGASTARRPRRGNEDFRRRRDFHSRPQHAVVACAGVGQRLRPSMRPLATPPVRKLAKDLADGSDRHRRSGDQPRADVENAVGEGFRPEVRTGPGLRPGDPDAHPGQGHPEGHRGGHGGQRVSAPHVTEFLMCRTR